MKELGEERKQLFRHHIEQNIERRTKGNLFQLRTNRWRHSTFDRVKLPQALKLRGPLLFAFGSIFIYGSRPLTRNDSPSKTSS
jgi:hypothetical protein